MVESEDAGYGEDEFLAISGIQHFAFCERQWALIHIERLWADNADTVDGSLFHHRAHLPGYSTDEGVVSLRSMALSSRKLGFFGYADIVELIPDKEGPVCFKGGRYRIEAVEYKKGAPKRSDCDRLQLCLQTLCLEEMFHCRVEAGSLFYGRTRRREKVSMDNTLREEAMTMIKRMRHLYEKGETPPGRRCRVCRQCSLESHCLPQASALSVEDYWSQLD